MIDSLGEGTVEDKPHTCWDHKIPNYRDDQGSYLCKMCGGDVQAHCPKCRIQALRLEADDILTCDRCGYRDPMYLHSGIFWGKEAAPGVNKK